MLMRLSLRLRIFLFFVLMAVGCIFIIIISLFLAYQRVEGFSLLSPFIQAASLAFFGILALICWVWFLFDEHVAKAIQRLSGGLISNAVTDSTLLPELHAARYLGDLVPAADTVVQKLMETKSDLTQAVQRETTRLMDEKLRLAAILSDLPVGIILCSRTHQIVFYNGQAVELLSSNAVLGLDHSIFSYLHQGPLSYAFEILQQSPNADSSLDVLCPTLEDGRMLSGKMRLLILDEGISGYVLKLRDVTAELHLHARREAFLEDVLHKIRRPAANIHMLAASLVDEFGTKDMPLLRGLYEESEKLMQDVTQFSADSQAQQANWWPRRISRLSEIIGSVQRELKDHDVVIDFFTEDTDVSCDAFALVRLIIGLVLFVQDKADQNTLSLLGQKDEMGGVITLSWSGTALSVGALEEWLDTPLDKDFPELAGRSVLLRHGISAWPRRLVDGRFSVRIPLPKEKADTPTQEKNSQRRAVYDFDLLSRDRSRAIIDTSLKDLAYVVFDTETTGLLPSQGDEIVQIAAMRVVNGRCVDEERFEMLVNPERPIPASATMIHGISDAMVKDSLTIVEAGQRFHKFAEGAVLVAHNAPFDLEFFHKNHVRIERFFDHPVLDTVLLSAVVFGQFRRHTLDALTQRLGIEIPPKLRHTAMGDTIGTANAFIRLIPMLNARGIVTFGETLTACRQHGRLLKDVNPINGTNGKPNVFVP